MLVASAVLFGAFLLSSRHLQNVLGAGPLLETGLAFLPFAVAIALGVHAAGHLVGKAGVRLPLAGGFAVTAVGMLLLSHVGTDGSYGADILPGMLVAGVGLGVILVSVSVALLTGAGEDEAGMLSGLNTTGHEVGGSIGIAVLVTIATAGVGAAPGAGAAAGLADGFLAAGIIAGAAGLLALVILPSATIFLPRLRVAPRVAVH